jgi:hypothetical protein
MRNRHTDAVVLLLAVLFAVYGVWVIWTQSFYAIDGHRYFPVADDALITFRYGWNLAHGDGLVWNAGERIEGISSILWALQASVFSLFVDKRHLPLAMQLAAVCWLLFTAYCFRQSARTCLGPRNGGFWTSATSVLAFLLPLSYSPLVFWSLRGMETSLQAALLASAVLLFLRARQRACLLGAVLLGLSCMARPDCIVPAGVIFAFRLLDVSKKRLHWKAVATELVPFICILSGVTVFRLIYYGALVPNTYVLKVSGMSVLKRIVLNGLGYIGPFISMSMPLIIAVTVSLLVRPTAEKILLAAIPASMLAYTIYVGGDAFPNWRFLAPCVPFVFLVLLSDLPRLNDVLRQHLQNRTAARLRHGVSLGLACVLLLTAARPPLFTSYIEQQRLPESGAIGNINTAIWLNDVLEPGASVGSFYAGSVPFYTGRYAVDFLGKSDRYLAALLPDTSGAVSWGGQTSVPGHNKYDLEYSILRRRPTYVQGLRWGRQDVRRSVRDVYVSVPVTFATAFHDRAILLLKDSTLVRWDRVRKEGTDPTIGHGR